METQLKPKRDRLTTAEKINRKKNQKKLSNMMAICRMYLAKERFEEAEKYARLRGFTTDQAREKTRDKGASLPPSPYKKEPAPVVAPGPATAVLVSGEKPEAMLNGWPMETDAIIWRGCRNRRLIILQLPDGREAAMWRGAKTNWRLGTQVRVVLESATGDPYYYQKEV